MTKEEKKDEFNQWVFDMDDALDDFFRRVPRNVAAKLDFSIRSLNVLESWILEKYPSYSSIEEQKESKIVDQLGRYIGETFRKNIGGHWTLSIDDPQDPFYLLPVIAGFGKIALPECPLSVLFASTDRREGNYISSVLEGIIEELSQSR